MKEGGVSPRSITSWCFLLTPVYNSLSSHLPLMSFLLFHVTDGWHEEGSGYAIQTDEPHRIQEEDKHLTWHLTVAHRFLWQTECRMSGWVLQVNPWTRRRWTSPLPEDDLRRMLNFHFVELCVDFSSFGSRLFCWWRGSELNTRLFSCPENSPGCFDLENHQRGSDPRN